MPSHYFPFSLSFWESKSDVISTYEVDSSDINRITYMPKVTLIICVEWPYIIPLQLSAQSFSIRPTDLYILNCTPLLSSVQIMGNETVSS